VQLPVGPDSSSPSQYATHVSRFLVAGVALVGAGLIVVNPAAGPGLPNVQHRAVQLTSGEQDWSQVLTTAEDNLTTLEGEAATANSDLSTAISGLSGDYSGQISTELGEAYTALQDSLSGGFYGNDDGYVFGLFEGSLTDPNNGVTETGSTLQEISTALQSDDLEQAFSYFDTWSLESGQHILEPLLNPLLDVTHHGVTSPALPGELLQILTNVVNEFGTWGNLQSLFDATLSPEISVFFGLTADLDNIAAEFAAGDTTQALSDLSNLGSDVTGDLLNGFVPDNPIDGSTTAFTGLLNSGSLLDELLVTWPTELTTALTETTTTTAAESASTALPDLFSGLF
jgi:hypothetical protein